MCVQIGADVREKDGKDQDEGRDWREGRDRGIEGSMIELKEMRGVELKDFRGAVGTGGGGGVRELKEEKEKKDNGADREKDGSNSKDKERSSIKGSMKCMYCVVFNSLVDCLHVERKGGALFLRLLFKASLSAPFCLNCPYLAPHAHLSSLPICDPLKVFSPR